MTEQTSSKQDWVPALRLMIRSFVLLVIAAVSIFVLVMCTPVVTPIWLRVITSGVLVVLAMAAGFASLGFFSVGVIRWAALGMNFSQITAAESTRQHTNRLLSAIGDRLLASDMSKRIVYRERDREALRTAIRQDISQHELNSAMSLVQIMSQLYGYHEEAEEFRDQIKVARAEEMDLKVAAAIERLDEILGRREWDQAADEAAKIQRQFPDSQRVKHLNQRVVDAREVHKHNLERQFLQAAQRDDVDRAMELLRELDRYLTEVEAEPFRETARGVIGKKRDNLGVQFKLAVHDKEWTGAVRVGEQLIREFPNSKMADEVRGMLDLLRTRATSQQAARA